MHITLIMVSTANGKITRGDDSTNQSWSSPEDATLLNALKGKYKLLVMGRKTWQRKKKQIKLQPNILRIILTKNPEKYVLFAVNGQLEFLNKTPKELIPYLETRGYSKMLLLGGSKTNTLFFRDKLIDELHLTIEPRIFSLGKNIIADKELAVQLQLVRVEKLNDSGTLHAIYQVIKS